MIVELANGAAVLIALCFLQGLITRYLRQDRLLTKLISGVLFGGICVLGMMSPISLDEGVIFDSRSVILAMSGLFGGPVTGTVAGLIAAAYRLSLGGAGVVAGFGVIASSVMLGIAYRYLFRRGWLTAGVPQYLVFGFVVHVICVGWFLMLPAEVVDNIIENVAIPFVFVFTLATGLLGFLLRDNDKRLQTEIDLMASQERFSRAVAGADEGIWDWNVHTGENYFSPRFEEMLGYETGGLVPVIETFHSLLHPDDRQKANDTIQAHFEGRTPYDVEYRLRCKNGEYKWVYVKGQAVWDDDGEATMLAGAITDITERKAIEAKLQESQTRMFLALDNIPNMVVIYDQNLAVRFVNAACRRALGKPIEEIVGKTDEEVWPPEICKIYLPALQEALTTGEPVSLQAEVPEPSGNMRFLRVSCVPILDEAGKVREVVRIAQDDTEQRATDEMLRHSQKMEAVGQLTGGIAHDLNNMLAIVLGNLELLQVKLADDKEAVGFIDEAYAGGQRAANMTRKLLTFSRKEPISQQLTNVNDFISGMENLIAKSLTPKIAVETHLTDGIWTVSVDPSDLENAILNICLNANDAMPDGGALVIETSNKTIDKQYVKSNPGSEAGDYVVIAVSDSGVGMTKATLSQIFEPFYSTKETGKGTGLGLSMVFGFVQRSGGHVKVYSEPGEGSTFRLYLPRARQTQSVTEAEFRREEAALPRGDELILVVDDEDGLLKVATAYLEELGYSTMVASSGREALAIVREHEGINLVFTDVVMPGGFDGYALGKEILKNYAGVKVLLASGFTAIGRSTGEGADAHLEAELSRRLLSKPYSRAELATAVRRALDA